MLVGRAGERTLFVTEQDRFDEVFWQGAAIDGDEGLAGALAATLDGTGNQFLTDTTFTEDQHRDRRTGGAFAQTTHHGHGRRRTDQVVERRTVGTVFLEARHFSG